MNYNKENSSSSLQHIAFIVDGNRRWAAQRNMSGVEGHRRGGSLLNEITTALMSYGIKYVSYFVFSTENWNRSQEEVNSLMDIFRELYDAFLGVVKKNRIRVVSIGNLEALPQDIFEKFKKMEEETKENSALTVLIAINYGGRDEIVRATKKLVSDVMNKKVDVNEITERVFEKYLDTFGIPYPDALVRTGECRISNFLLWQVAYSEMFFIDKYWPDFCEADLKDIINDFSKRKRRYGE